MAAIAHTALELEFIAIDTARNSTQTISAIIAITALAVVLDHVRKRVAPEPPPASPPLTPTP